MSLDVTIVKIIIIGNILYKLLMQFHDVIFTNIFTIKKHDIIHLNIAFT